MNNKKIFLAFIFTLILTMCFVRINAVNAANVYTMDPSFLSEMKLKGINLNIKTLNKNEIDIKNSSITRLDVDSSNIAFLINNNNGNAVTYTGSPYLMRVKFENVGQIGNQSVDAFVTVNRIVLGNMWTSSGKRNPAGTMFFMIKNASIWFGCASTTLEDYVYSADQDIDISVNVVWSGTNTTVDYPFVTGIFDLDANKNQTNNKTVEKWTAGNGYSKNYFVYSTTTLTRTGDTWSNSLENQNTTDEDERLLTGVYAESDNGAFSSSYREGHSATALKVYSTSPNDVNQLGPTLTSKITNSSNTVKSKVDSTTDNITYTVTQKLGTMFIDMFTPYKSLSIEDTVPNDLVYKSATVKLQDGNNIIDITNNSAYGSLSYNESTRKLVYTFNPNWLSTRENYKGQTVTMTINTGIKNIVSQYSNTAYTNINLIGTATNTVTNDSVKNTPVYSYVSGTAGKELPSAISTTTGDYKIGDNTKYLVGELVTRNNSISVGTKYRVYDSNNKLLGTWELTSWNSDSIEMSISGVEFIGTWKYISVGNINIIESDYSDTHNANIGEDDENVISSIPFSQSDLDALADGKDISVYLEIEDISDDIPLDDKAEHESNLDENENIGEYLDIRLLKRVDDETPTRVNETNEPIKIDFDIPEELINTDTNITRIYRLLKLNDDGSLSEQDIEVSNEKLSFETTYFTTYVLTYSDIVDVPVYRYISGTAGKELPSAISTTTGDYKIGDNTKYLVGELVTRNNSIGVGTKYRVYGDGDKALGTWKLTDWNVDSIEMTINGVEFIGTWEYVDVGSIDVIETEASNPYNANIGEDDENVISSIPFSQSDLDALADGKDISVYLEIEDISDDIPLDDKTGHESNLDENENIGEYLDIRLLKRVDDETPTRINETDEPIKIDFDIPEELINTDTNITRTYRLLKLNDDGSLSELDIEVSNEKLSFETTYFTTYVLTYSDVTNIEPEDPTLHNPKTVDSFISNFIRLVISLLSFTFTLIYIKRNKRSRQL